MLQWYRNSCTPLVLTRASQVNGLITTMILGILRAGCNGRKQLKANSFNKCWWQLWFKGRSENSLWVGYLEKDSRQSLDWLPDRSIQEIPAQVGESVFWLRCYPSLSGNRAPPQWNQLYPQSSPWQITCIDIVFLQ